LDLSLRQALHPGLSLTPDGISEYTFANLFLFRRRYKYQVSLIPDNCFVLSGEHDGKRFFMTPFSLPNRDALMELLRTHDYWKCIPDAVLLPNQADLESWGIEIAEDRDNFDYLFLRAELADLTGKKYHKKRNHINAFLSANSGHREERLTPQLIPQAMAALDQWRQDKGEDGDYVAAREALELFTELKLKGVLYLVNDEPIGYCLGESLAKGRMFAVHFQKGIDAYRGIYQYMNQAFPAYLPNYYTHLNWEQDLGDPGLRQAKMTYRPVGFVKKSTGKLI